jgi:PIN domain nuclease of toxin-antitoxin system
MPLHYSHYLIITVTLFDPLLIAQARHEGFKFVSRDAIVASYGVPHIVA